MPKAVILNEALAVQRLELERQPVVPLNVSYGLWGAVNGGGDPFGGATRKWNLYRGLELCAKAGVKGISTHDGDLLDDDAKPPTRRRVIAGYKRRLANLGLKAVCYTTNLFSNKVFLAGAFSSTDPRVRRAAVLKCCRAMDEAAMLEVENFIFWGGREGTEVGEQDSGEAVRHYMECIRLCVLYAVEQGYAYNFTIEPKAYEPRFDLYLGTGASALLAILHYFPEPELRARIGVNLEVPQHLAMITLCPWLDLGQMLDMDKLGAVLHLGGQPAGRMDADFGMGVGRTNYFDDFQTRKHLHTHRWQRWAELDCRPLRTTTRQESLLAFLQQNIRYLRTMEGKLQVYLDDPTVLQLERQIFGRVQPVLEEAMELARKELPPIKEFGLRNWGVANAIKKLGQGFKGFADTAAELNTDVIEQLNYRTCMILLGDESEKARKTVARFLKTR
ncbi:MAG: TIM barrel protein [Patescibacteria group bacterium]|nr:TIM barrel protein [Patescibacteria group bacterium]